MEYAGTLGETFAIETGFFDDNGKYELTPKGWEVLKELQEGRSVYIEQDRPIDTSDLPTEQIHMYDYIMKFVDKNTIEIEIFKVIQYGFEEFPDSPPECSEYYDREYYTYGRKEGESDIEFISRIVFMLDSEFE